MAGAVSRAKAALKRMSQDRKNAVERKALRRKAVRRAKLRGRLGISSERVQRRLQKRVDENRGETAAPTEKIEKQLRAGTTFSELIQALEPNLPAVSRLKREVEQEVTAENALDRMGIIDTAKDPGKRRRIIGLYSRYLQRYNSMVELGGTGLARTDKHSVEILNQLAVELGGRQNFQRFLRLSTKISRLIDRWPDEAFIPKEMELRERRKRKESLRRRVSGRKGDRKKTD